MEDLNSALSKVLQEITDCQFRSVAEISDGRILGRLLNQIDPRFFPSSDKSLNSWSNARARLDHYLAMQDLVDQSLDFDLEDIRKGETQAIASALLQIFAIMAVFSPVSWERILNSIDYRTKVSIGKFLEHLVADINEALLDAKNGSKAFGSESPQDIKVVLQKLEKHQVIMQEHQKSVERLREELSRAKAEKERLSQALQEKNPEIEMLQQVKDEALRMLETTYVNTRRTSLPAEDLQKKVNQLNRDVDALNEKLFELRSATLDRENEIDRLKFIQSFLEHKKTEVEETTKQLGHYRQKCEELKKDKEIYDSKLKCFEYADRNISQLKSYLIEEKRIAANLRAKLADQEKAIGELRSRLGSSENTMSVMQKSMKEGLQKERSEVSTGKRIGALESENGQLRHRIQELLAEQKELEFKDFIEELQAKEAEIFRSRLSERFLENQASGEKARARLRSPGPVSMNSILLEENAGSGPVNEAKSRNHSEILRNARTGDFLSDREEDNRRGQFEYEAEDFMLAYTAAMSFADKNLRLQVSSPGGEIKERDIFKPFDISKLFIAHKQ